MAERVQFPAVVAMFAACVLFLAFTRVAALAFADWTARLHFFGERTDASAA
jgi:hypothetical protein